MNDLDEGKTGPPDGAPEQVAEDAQDAPIGGEEAPTTAAEGEDLVVVDDEHEGDELVRDPNELVAELEQKLAAEHERLLRAAADLDNLRKRTRRDVEDAAIRGRVEVLNDLLPAIDSLDLALGASDRDGAAGPVLDGVEMVRRQFLAAMSRHGLKPVESAVGQPFDPAVHEAVAQLPSAEHPVGAVVEEMRKGYVLGDRLLRAAMVVVSAGPPQEQAGSDLDTGEPEGDDGTEKTGAEESDG